MVHARTCLSDKQMAMERGGNGRQLPQHYATFLQVPFPSFPEPTFLHFAAFVANTVPAPAPGPLPRPHNKQGLMPAERLQLLSLGNLRGGGGGGGGEVTSTRGMQELSFSPPRQPEVACMQAYPCPCGEGLWCRATSVQAENDALQVKLWQAQEREKQMQVQVGCMLAVAAAGRPWPLVHPPLPPPPAHTCRCTLSHVGAHVPVLGACMPM